MKTAVCGLAIGAVVLLTVAACGQEAPKADQKKSATDSTGQAIVDSIKAPIDKSRQVENKLEKAAERTGEAVKDQTP